MMAESQNSGKMNAAIARQRQGKYLSAAKNAHRAVEKLLSHC
jgi:hypothetical protein